MGKNIIGIDPGIADTGFGVIEKLPGGKTKCLDFGSIKTAANTPLPDRLAILERELLSILDKYKPSLAAIEELFFANNAKTALVVGQARGVVLLTLKKAGIPIVEFTPPQVKQSISCYGKADKRQVQKMVALLLGLKELPKPDDAADALAIALTGMNDLKL